MLSETQVSLEAPLTVIKPQPPPFEEWLPRLHFGRWRDPTWGPWLKAAWGVIGLVPAVMFVTGLIMWWNGVVRRRRSAPVVEETPAYSPLAS